MVVVVVKIFVRLSVAGSAPDSSVRLGLRARMIPGSAELAWPARDRPLPASVSSVCLFCPSVSSCLSLLFSSLLSLSCPCPCPWPCHVNGRPRTTCACRPGPFCPSTWPIRFLICLNSLPVFVVRLALSKPVSVLTLCGPVGPPRKPEDRRRPGWG